MFGFFGEKEGELLEIENETTDLADFFIGWDLQELGKPGGRNVVAPPVRVWVRRLFFCLESPQGAIFCFMCLCRPLRGIGNQFTMKDMKSMKKKNFSNFVSFHGEIVFMVCKGKRDVSGNVGFFGFLWGLTRRLRSRRYCSAAILAAT